MQRFRNFRGLAHVTWTRALLVPAAGLALLVPLALLAPASQAATQPASPGAGAAAQGRVSAGSDSPADVVTCAFNASKPVHQRNTGKNKRKYPYEIVARGALVLCVPHEPALCRTQEQLLMGVPLPDGDIAWSVEATGRPDYKCPAGVVVHTTATLLCRDRSATPYWWKSRTLETIEQDGQIGTKHVDSPRIFSRC